MSKPRDSAAAASYGGYDYTFVVPVSDDFHCSICTKVNNPRTLSVGSNGVHIRGVPL